MTWLRAVAAGVLSLLFPGAGHALLRDWLRALLFGGLYVAAVWFFYPIEDLAGGSMSDVMSDSMEVAAEIDPMAQMTILLVVAIATFDAVLRALGFPLDGGSSGESDGPTCPECGKEIDEDLEFCHWCTTRLEPAEDDDAEVEPEETARS